MIEKTPQRESTELERTTPGRALTDFEEMDRIFDRMFDEFFPRGWLRPFHGGRFGRPRLSELALEARTPRVDLIDREEDILVRAELPGVTKKDLSVSLTEDTVTIRAEMEHEEKEKEEHFFRHEITRGAFSRTLPLPCHVKGGEAKAHFKDGVLELTLPKVEKAKRVTIKVE